MPKFTKHVGRVETSGKKCVVVFREIPNEPTSCLVVETESLPSIMHDDLQQAVESATAQSDMDFYKYAQRTTFNDGRNMLDALHLSKLLKKYKTSEIVMMPDINVSIALSELNDQLSALNAGKTTSGDIGKGQEPPPLTQKSADVLDDADIAKQLRSQAEYFSKEAARLLKEAEELSPSKQTIKIKKSEEKVLMSANEDIQISTPKVKRAYNKKK